MGVKQFARKAIRATGFDVVRAAKRPEPQRDFVPFVQDYDIGDIDFQMWIADATAAVWYEAVLINSLAELTEMARHVKPGYKILDIGAHHGLHMTVCAKAAGPTGFVLSVEASPHNAMIASSQVALNGFKNVKVINAAAGDKPGKLNLTFGTNGVVTSSAEAISVTAVTIDELDALYGPFDAIKIDVEGYEGFVLDGAKTTLKRLPTLFLELHTPYLAPFGYDAKDVLARLDPSYRGTFVTRTDRETVRPYGIDDLPFDIANLTLTAR